MQRTWKRTVPRVFITVAVLLVLLRACFHFSYKETPYREVFIRETPQGKYELEFRYRAQVSGNMHGPSLPFSSSSSDNARWFYVARREGNVEGGQVILTYYRGCKDPLYWQKAMRGEVVLTQTSVTFALKMPRYDRPDGTTTNEVQRYEDWEHNGTYTLIAAPSTLPTPTAGDYSPSSC